MRHPASDFGVERLRLFLGKIVRVGRNFSIIFGDYFTRGCFVNSFGVP
jgi:hypothetical protein